MAALASLIGIAPAATFVCISNAEDGDISTCRLLNKYPVGKGANWVEIVSFD